MGGGFGVIPLLVALAVVAVVVGAALVRASARRAGEVHDAVHDEDVATLTYTVPDGQDPVAVASALQQHGFRAHADHATGLQQVLVVVPETADPAVERERARAVIGEASLNLEGDRAPSGKVRFADER